MNRRRQTLAAFNEWKKRDFTWGDAYCCQFAAYVAKKITGIDYVSAFKYDSEDDAQRIIDKDGGLSALLTRVLGNPSDERADGDPVLLDIPLMGELVGVGLGTAAVALTERSMLRIDSRYVVRGWHL